MARGDTSAAENDHAQLIKELWQAAVNLRGSIEPADYKTLRAADYFPPLPLYAV